MNSNHSLQVALGHYGVERICDTETWSRLFFFSLLLQLPEGGDSLRLTLSVKHCSDVWTDNTQIIRPSSNHWATGGPVLWSSVLPQTELMNLLLKCTQLKNKNLCVLIDSAAGPKWTFKFRTVIFGVDLRHRCHVDPQRENLRQVWLQPGPCFLTVGFYLCHEVTKEVFMRKNGNDFSTESAEKKHAVRDRTMWKWPLQCWCPWASQPRPHSLPFSLRILQSHTRLFLCLTRTHFLSWL